jgi:hypothetical protein
VTGTVSFQEFGRDRRRVSVLPATPAEVEKTSAEKTEADKTSSSEEAPAAAKAPEAEQAEEA